MKIIIEEIPPRNRCKANTVEILYNKLRKDGHTVITVEKLPSKEELEDVKISDKYNKIAEVLNEPALSPDKITIIRKLITAEKAEHLGDFVFGYDPAFIHPSMFPFRKKF